MSPTPNVSGDSIPIVSRKQSRRAKSLMFGLALNDQKLFFVPFCTKIRTRAHLEFFLKRICMISSLSNFHDSMKICFETAKFKIRSARLLFSTNVYF